MIDLKIILDQLIMRRIFYFITLLLTFNYLLATGVQAQTETSWSMAGANPERSSWVPEGVGGGLKVEWFKPFEAYILPRIQIITANDTLYISTSKGLYAINSDTGDVRWVYPTEMPLGHSPTIENGVAYVGGFDKKLHAIDALTGQGLWSFDAQQGFQTNPLVVNNIVYAGNRDGNMYAVYAQGSTQGTPGTLAWKYKTDGPVLFSAAYSNGDIYFASNDMHAYALNAGNGSLVWKSEKLPGNGFHSWWPVVYNNYVIFAGSMNYRRPDWYDVDKPDVFIDYWTLPEGTHVGIEGREPGDWVAGTPTLDLSQPHVVPEGTTAAVTEYYEQKPWRRTYLVLDKTNGQEITYDFDNDGLREYAPIIWHGQHGGSRYPPIIGGDGVLYQSMVYRTRQYITLGHIVGWKADSPYISVISGDETPADETLAYSAGGNYIYFNEFVDRQGGSIDISRPMPDINTGGAREQWYHNYGLHTLIPGYSGYFPTYFYSSYNGKLVFGSDNGVYGMHGDYAPPIPYKGRVYSINSNSVLAFSSNGTNGNVGLTQAAVQSASTIAPLPSKNELQQRLETEIQKMLNAGHLQPGYISSGSFEWASLYQGCGDYLHDYWHHPADTIEVLVSALPHLPAQMQTDLRAYIQNEYSNYPPYFYNHIGWTSGVQRETATRNADANTIPDAQAPTDFGPIQILYDFVWRFSPHAYYSLFKYAQEFGNADQILQTAENSQLHASLMNVAPDSDLIMMPDVHNAYITGYFGYLNLASLAGRPEDQTIRAELNRLLQLRSQNFDLGSQYGAGSYCRAITTSRNFMYMVPELADYLYNNNQTEVQAALDEYYRLAPYWFVSKVEVSFAETTLRNLYDYHSLFQAKAHIMKEPYEELAKYLDVPVVERGDLFYIDNLVSALEAQSIGTGSPTPTPPAGGLPGDANGDDKVDGVDYVIWLTQYLNYNPTPNSDPDFNQSGTVDGVDYVIWLNNYTS